MANERVKLRYRRKMAIGPFVRGLALPKGYGVKWLDSETLEIKLLIDLQREVDAWLAEHREIEAASK